MTSVQEIRVIGKYLLVIGAQDRLNCQPQSIRESDLMLHHNRFPGEHSSAYGNGNKTFENQGTCTLIHAVGIISFIEVL